MKILLPVDGSELSLWAVRHAIELARSGLQARFVLANVQEPPTLYEVVTAHDAQVLEGRVFLTMMEALLLADLVTELPAAVRLQRLVSTLRGHFRCGAVALLRLEGDHLRPVAVDGLVREALGRGPGWRRHVPL